MTVEDGEIVDGEFDEGEFDDGEFDDEEFDDGEFDEGEVEDELAHDSDCVAYLERMMVEKEGISSEEFLDWVFFVQVRSGGSSLFITSPGPYCSSACHIGQSPLT